MPPGCRCHWTHFKYDPVTAPGPADGTKLAKVPKPTAHSPRPVVLPLDHDPPAASRGRARLLCFWACLYVGLSLSSCFRNSTMKNTALGRCCTPMLRDTVGGGRVDCNPLDRPAVNAASPSAVDNDGAACTLPCGPAANTAFA